MGRETKKLFEASAEAMKILARKHNIYLPCGCDDPDDDNASARDKSRYRFAVEQIHHLNNIRNDEEYHNMVQQVSKGENIGRHREFMKAKGYMQYLKAASGEIYWRLEENKGLAIPMQWDVAYFMGAIEDDAIDEFDERP